MTSLKLADMTTMVPANDNHRRPGQHEWPAYDRLKAERLMRTPEQNRTAMVALCRLRHNLVATEGQGEQSTFRSDNAGVDEDVARRFGADLIVEKVTGDHLVALHMSGDLEYRRAPDGQVLPFKKDGEKAYQLEDRYRGEKGSARPEHPQDVEAELNGRYDGAAWPKAPGAARSARQVFHGAQIKTRAAPRTFHSPEESIVKSIYAAKTLAFIKGGLPAGLWAVLEMAATGSTSESIGEGRGHSGRYASAVGTELQRIALEALIEVYADYDGCHAEAA
ncbi:hypothetical protein [Devosia sp. A369]